MTVNKILTAAIAELTVKFSFYKELLMDILAAVTARSHSFLVVNSLGFHIQNSLVTLRVLDHPHPLQLPGNRLAG